MTFSVVATGLRYPEGPCVDRQGNLYVVEIAGGRVSRVGMDGSITAFAQTGGGPNGAAFGPDGNMYVANNGARWRAGPSTDNTEGPANEPGRIERATPDGQVSVLIAEIAGQALASPNDIVFDPYGNFYFTDPVWGPVGAASPPGAVCFSDISGRAKRVHVGLRFPNGIGVTEDGGTLIVAESRTFTLHAFPILEPGVLGEPRPYGFLGEDVGPDGFCFDAEGYLICAGARSGKLHILPPGGGERVGEIAVEDPLVTNVCFGGPDFSTLFVTESLLGRVLSIDWVRPGMRLFPDR